MDDIEARVLIPSIRSISHNRGDVYVNASRHEDGVLIPSIRSISHNVCNGKSV